MTRLFTLMTLVSLAAVPAHAHHHRLPGPAAPAAELPGAEPDHVERACRGPGGRLVPCPRPGRPLG